MARPVRTRRRRSRRGRRRHRRLRRRDRAAGRQHRPVVMAGRRISRGGARCHCGPSVRFQPAGGLLWRTGDSVRHCRSDPGRRRAEHEPDPHLVGHDRRRAVRVHLAHQRIQELAAPLRRSGDLAVPWCGADRREVEHLPRGDGAVRADQPSAGSGRDSRRTLRERDHRRGRLQDRRRPARHVAGEDGGA